MVEKESYTPHVKNYPEEADVSFSESISFSAVPETVRAWLEGRMHIHGSSVLDIARISHGKDDATYCVLTKPRPNLNSEKTSQAAFVVDYIRDDVAGYLHVLKSEQADSWGMAGIPYVADTQTFTTEHFDYKNRGLSDRRLDSANWYCMKHFHQPLHSGDYYQRQNVEYAEKPWMNREADGRVVVVTEDPRKGKRYRYAV